jgi:RHS repeat-associated protein
MMVDPTGSMQLARSYEPYGSILSSSGPGSTNYGFDGEPYDSYINLLNLRARQYSSQDGRFLQKDPLQSGNNYFSFANSNPTNLTDPTGLFSKQQIAESYGFNNFESVLAYLGENGKHWGFIGALLDALPGDTMIGSYFDIGDMNGNYGRPRYKPTGSFKIGYGNEGITFNDISMKSLIASPNYPIINELNTSSIPWGSHGELWWRNQENSRYELLGKSPTDYRYYDDGGETSELPDFHGWWLGASPSVLGGSLAKMIDRYGNEYYSINLGASVGSPIEFGYFEGYAGSAIDLQKAKYRLDEETLKNDMQGVFTCETTHGGLIIGGEITTCSQNKFSTATFSMGVQVGISKTSSITWFSGQDKNLSWQSGLDDKLRGWKQDSFQFIDGIPYDSCKEYMPLQNRR